MTWVRVYFLDSNPFLYKIKNRFKMKLLTLCGQLFIDGMRLITKIRNNIKKSLMHLQDKIVLKKGVIIEAVNDELEKYLSNRTYMELVFWSFLNKPAFRSYCL